MIIMDAICKAHHILNDLGILAPDMTISLPAWTEPLLLNALAAYPPTSRPGILATVLGLDLMIDPDQDDTIRCYGDILFPITRPEDTPALTLTDADLDAIVDRVLARLAANEPHVVIHLAPVTVNKIVEKTLQRLNELLHDAHTPLTKSA